MKLNPKAFNAQLANMGQRVAWRRAAFCPCRDPHSGAARQGCPICGAKGVFWGDSTDAWTGVASQRVVREWAAFGLWESGDEVLSIPSNSPLYAVGEFDRIIMASSSEPFNSVLIRGTESLLYPVVAISRVFWLSDDRTTVVEGVPPEIAPDGAIVWWPTGTVGAPPTGKQFSLQGRKRPEFFLFKDFPSDRAHFDGEPLPRRAVARRFDLFGR